MATAQSARSGGSEIQKFMAQYQQIAAEKTALQTQMTQMKSDLDKSKADLAAMKKERDALKSRSGASPAAVAQLTASKDTAEKALETSKQRMSELVGRFRETAATLKESEADRAKLRRDLEERRTAFDQCAQNNLELFEITSDVLERYENVGLFRRTAASEPFTKITRTRIENLVDEYRARAMELRSKNQK
jgi:chromosome segregation ATPase